VYNYNVTDFNAQCKLMGSWDTKISATLMDKLQLWLRPCRPLYLQRNFKQCKSMQPSSRYMFETRDIVNYATMHQFRNIFRIRFLNILYARTTSTVPLVTIPVLTEISSCALNSWADGPTRHPARGMLRVILSWATFTCSCVMVVYHSRLHYTYLYTVMNK